MTKKLLFFKNNLNFKINNLKILFFITLIIRTFISICSNSWINAWIGIEINLLSFIPLIINKKKSSNSTIIYFIIQAIASSLILLITIIIKIEFNLIKINIIFRIINFRLLIKLGAAPIHWWIPKVFININWKIGFWFLTWQKITPIILINSSINNNLIIYLMIIISIITGAIIGLNQTIIKLIIIYSSINHIGWILMTIILNLSLFIIYFIIYSIINLIICLVINNFNINHLNQIFKNNNQNPITKIIIISIFLSLGGIPPFLGFLPKIFTLISIINNNIFLESFLFIIIATLTLSFYINPLLTILLSIKLSTKWNFKNKIHYKNILRIFILNILLSLIILPLIIKLYIF